MKDRIPGFPEGIIISLMICVPVIPNAIEASTSSRSTGDILSETPAPTSPKRPPIAANSGPPADPSVDPVIAPIA